MDIHWAAGIYEGEGSTQSYHKGCQIRVGQKERWLCDKLRGFFGGRVAERRMNDQPFYEWTVSGPRARGFLLTMYMLLSPRRQDQIQQQMTAW